MKQIISWILLLLPILAHAQDLLVYRDTVDNFSIGIPVGWTYGTLKNEPTIKLFARQTNPDTLDHIFANYNLNIFKSDDSSFDDAYTTFLSSITEANKFLLVDSGRIRIDDVDYRWIIETHENANRASLIMANYVFMTYKNRTSYILTFVGPERRYKNLKPLFEKIAESLRI